MKHALGGRRSPRKRSRESGPPPVDHLVAWGLQPSQWRTSGVLVPPPQRAVLVWRLADHPSVADAALRARRAYDALAERGTPLRADSTPRGIEVVLPLRAVVTHLALLAEWGILPDTVLVSDGGQLDEIDALQREVTRLRAPVVVAAGEALEDGWIAELRRAAWLEA
jgi:hypothetical protein